ncbi:MAG: hypothetical protein ACI835_002382 [Planctomycetota bacterium]|jgi:hypothetical protein
MVILTHILPLALTGLIFSPTSDEVRTDLSAAEERILETLRESREARSMESEPWVDSIEDDIGKSIPLLLELLETRRIPKTEDDHEAQRLSEPQRSILLSGLSRMPAAKLVNAAETLLEAQELDAHDYALAIVLRSLTASPAQLEPISQLALAVKSEDAKLHPALEAAFGESLQRMLEDEPACASELGFLRASSFKLLLPRTIRAIGKARTALGCSTLLWIARTEQELRPAVFAQIRLTGPSHDEAVNTALIKLMVDHVRSAPEREKRSAVVALGELEHPRAVEVLIPLLEAESGVASDALWSLQKITGMRFAADPFRWKHWFEQEIKWQHEAYPAVVQDLHGTDAAKAVAAIRTLATHHLHRKLHSQELARALDEGPRVRKPMICSALQMLNSDDALPALLRAFDTEEERQRNAALRALAAISELDLPSEYGGMRDELLRHYPDLRGW